MKMIKVAATVAAFLLTACCPAPQKQASFQVVSINDVYNIEGVESGNVGGLARVATLRESLLAKGASQDILLLHAGDFLYPSSLSSMYNGEQMIDAMNWLDGSADFDDKMFVTFGNHEFDKSKAKHASIVRERITESDFYWLGTNVLLDSSASSEDKGFIRSLVPSKVVELDGVKVGLFSITTDMKIPEYAAIDGRYKQGNRMSAYFLNYSISEVLLCQINLYYPILNQLDSVCLMVKICIDSVRDLALAL